MIGAIASALAGAGEMSFAIRSVLAATATWVLAALACVLLRSSSAAVRHRVWSTSAAACLVLPALVLVVPQWRIGGGIPAVSQSIGASATVANHAARTAEYRVDAHLTAEVPPGASVPP